MSSDQNRTFLRFVQIGDLHLTEQGLQNHDDFIHIVHELNRHVRGSIDFVYLPGDNADDGTDRQFDLVRGGLSELSIPWRAIPGDHDFKPRSLDQFYRSLSVPHLPFAEEVGGCLCLFLDIVSQGTGGPNFRLGREQFGWLKDRLAEAQRAGRPCVVFMHAYPADLGDEASAVSELLDASTTRFVAMGTRITTSYRTTDAPFTPQPDRQDRSKKAQSASASRRSTATSSVGASSRSILRGPSS